MASTYLTGEASRRLRLGGTWVARDAILSIEGTPSDGEPVLLKDEEGHLIGVGDLDLQSSFTVRRLGLPEEPADGIIPRHLRRAIERRAQYVEDPRYCRLVNDDGDGLPGLVVDRMGDHLVVQTFTRAMDARLGEIARLLVEAAGARSVLLRNDSPRREQLGLKLRRPHVLHGTPPRWSRLLELGARFTVDLQAGVNTGFFYDQRAIRRHVARMAAGARVLDPCCLIGGLFVHAGLHGARRILAFDRDEDALTLARENAEINGLSGRTELSRAGPFAALEGLRDPFDLVLLDVPALPPPEPGADGRDTPLGHLLRLCIHHTRRGGRMVVVGYQPPLGPGQLDDALTVACEQEGRVGYRVARPGLPPDFPTVLGSPGAEYLSALALELS